MKVSELIEYLNKVIKEDGDLDIFIEMGEKYKVLDCIIFEVERSEGYKTTDLEKGCLCGSCLIDVPLVPPFLKVS